MGNRDEGICRGGDLVKSSEVRAAEGSVIGKMAAMWTFRIEPVEETVMEEESSTMSVSGGASVERG